MLLRQEVPTGVLYYFRVLYQQRIVHDKIVGETALTGTDGQTAPFCRVAV